MKGSGKLKIYIRLNNGKSFKIPAPLFMVKAALGFGGFGALIAKKYIPENQRQYIDCIDFRELRKGFDVLRDYKGLTLVDVHSSDGTEVIITV